MPRTLDPTKPTGAVWGPYPSTAELPNVAGAAVQSDQVTMGDLACTVSGTTVEFFVCTAPAQGAATWTEVPFAGGSITTISTSGAISAGTTLAAGTTVTAGTGITATTGNITATAGDLNAVGGHRTVIGPFKVTLAAGQTATAVPIVGADVAFATLRAGSVTAMRANLDAAVTGADQSVQVRVNIGGSTVAASEVDLTQAGAEVTALYSGAKDAVGFTFTAGQAIEVEYDSDTITNTPELEVWLEIEQ